MAKTISTEKLTNIYVCGTCSAIVPAWDNGAYLDAHDDWHRAVFDDVEQFLSSDLSGSSLD